MMPFNSGWASHAGVVDAMIADTDLKEPQQVFEGDRGYFQALVVPNPHDMSRLVENLEDVHDVAEIMRMTVP